MKTLSQTSYITNAFLQLNAQQFHEFAALKNTDVGVIHFRARQEKTRTSCKYFAFVLLTIFLPDLRCRDRVTNRNVCSSRQIATLEK